VTSTYYLVDRHLTLNYIHIFLALYLVFQLKNTLSGNTIE